MAILIGATTAGGALHSSAEKKGYATKRECLATGKLTELKVTVDALNKAEEVRLGIFADSAGAVGAAIVETGAIAVVKEKAETVGGAVTETELIAGTTYWLGFIPLKGAGRIKATEKASWGFKTTLAVTKFNEGTWTASEVKFGEPAPIWGEGTTGVPIEGKATGAALLTGTAKGSTTEVLKGKATGSVLLTGTSKPKLAEVLKGKSTGTLLLGGTAKGAAGGPATGKATGTLTLRGTAKGSAKEMTSRRAIIMIFDE